MDSTKIIEILAYTLPSLITGGVAYFLFDSYFNFEKKESKFLKEEFYKFGKRDRFKENKDFED